MISAKEKKGQINKILKSVANINQVDKLVDKYEEMVSEFLLNNYEIVLVKCGKFIEDFYQVLDFAARQSIASKPNLTKIRKRLKTAITLQKIQPSVKSLVADSLKIAYKFRNSRDGAHSNDFISNKIDAYYVISISKWSLAEMIRIYSNMSLVDSNSLIDEIIEIPTPHIQRFEGDILVLASLSAANEILSLLYFSVDRRCEIDKIKEMIKLHSKANITTSLYNLENKRLIYRKSGVCYLSINGEKKIVKLIKELEKKEYKKK